MTTTSAHPMDGQNSTTPHQSMQARTQEWGTRWNRDAGTRDKPQHQMHALRRQALSTTPRNWTTEAVRHFLSNVKGNRARGIDGWNPSKMLRLHWKAIEVLARVLQDVEEILALPAQIFVNIVAFQRKPNGAGGRPITLAGCLYAMCMAGCKSEPRLGQRIPWLVGR